MTRRHLVAAATAVLVGATTVGYALSNDGEIGPARHETANGRVLHPAGVITHVGNFPTGPLIVCMYALLLIVAGIGKRLAVGSREIAT